MVRRGALANWPRVACSTAGRISGDLWRWASAHPPTSAQDLAQPNRAHHGVRCDALSAGGKPGGCGVRMRVCDAQGSHPPPSSQAGRTAGSRPSLPCKPGSAEGRVGEHLNEATITRLGSILECGNMDGNGVCRCALANLRDKFVDE